MSRAAPWLLALVLCGCTSYRVVCSDLRAALEDCGVAVNGLKCSAIPYHDLSELTEELESRGCAAMGKDDHAVDPRLCAVAEWPCPHDSTAPFTPAAPKHAVVFVGGIESNALFAWNQNIVRETPAGTRVFVVQPLSWETTPARADDLWASLRSLQARLGPGTQFHLVCYAVGGIDCRYLASPGGLFAKDPAQYAKVRASLASVTTVATPHRGTRVAEAALEALRSGTATELLRSFIGESVVATVPDDAALVRTLEGLTLDALHRFNQTVVDAPDLPYFSYAGVSHLGARVTTTAEERIAKFCVDAQGAPLYLRLPDTKDETHPFLSVTMPFAAESRSADGATVYSPADGMVSVASATWGEFLGCIPADHYDVIGQPGHTTRDPRTGFDPRTFWRAHLTTLAARGL